MVNSGSYKVFSSAHLKWGLFMPYTGFTKEI